MLWLRRHVPALVFLMGAIVLVFGAGMMVASLRVFPFGYVREAAEAAEDWGENWRHYLQVRSKYAAPLNKPAGATVIDPAAVYPGYTFVTAYREGRFRVLLLDMQGTVVHEWGAAFSEIWPRGSGREVVPPDFDISIHGAALLPDGAVVVSFEGSGVAKIDRCSQVVWRVPIYSHHTVTALPSGEFLVPIDRRLTEPGPDLPGVKVADQGWVLDGSILHLDADGRTLSETSLLHSLFASGLAALLFANGQDNPLLHNTEDPLHFNDVEVLSEQDAAAFPQFAAGDLLVSMRNLNTIAVLDRQTKLIKWRMTGPFLRQHDPDFLPNGHILVFDNRKGGTEREFGYSEILEIDPATRRVTWRYTGSDREPFYSNIRGKQEQLPNGNVLVTEPEGGRVFELAREAEGGRIVWEWVNGIGGGLAGLVTQADRIEPGRVGFLGQPCGAGPATALAEPGPGAG